MSTINKIKKGIEGFDNYLIEGYQSSINTLLQNAPTLSAEEAQQLTYIQNNFETVKGILATYEPSAEIKILSEKLSSIQVYIIMENWCGSSAANVPYIAKILETIPNVSITITPRDANEDFMNAYLSNGKKSIPIVVAFDKLGNELFVWGSATQKQTTYASTLQAQNLPFPDFIAAMKLWFADNNATAIEEDFTDILKSVIDK